jgi:hypothetical protein
MKLKLSSLVFSLVLLRLKLRTSCLLGGYSTLEPCLQSFCSGYFLPTLVRTMISCFMLPTSLGWQAHTTRPSFFHWDGVLQTFLPALTWHRDHTNLSLPYSLGWQACTTSSWLRWESHNLFAQAGHKPWSSQSQPPKELGLQAWATGSKIKKLALYKDK